MRVSGPDSFRFLAALTGGNMPPPRRAGLRRLSHRGSAIDRALTLRFEGPASFTGEDMAEFHIHGGVAVARSLARALEDLGGRQAEPGEFSKRAFLNGKIDLTEAEAIADLIDAESAAQQAQALAQAEGALTRLYEGWRHRLIQALACVEATLDFPDEDLPSGMLVPVRADMALLAREIGSHLEDARRGERLRHGLYVAILGAPNAGKSSLMNALAGRDIAIVSARAGTTRDVIEAHLDLGGYPVILADTAGLRDSADPVEQEGMARARARAADADIRILVFDATRGADAATMALAGDNTLTVAAKSDLATQIRPCWADFTLISTKTGDGIEEFLIRLTSMIAASLGDRTSPPPTRERHRVHLVEALAALTRFSAVSSLDLAAEDLRLALAALGRITGRVDVETVLDALFRDFCIGK